MDQEKQFVQEIKNLYLNSKLEECISRINQLQDIKDFKCYQELQLYKGISIFEQSSFDEGYKFMDNLFKEIKAKKGDKIEEIDLVIQILYQWQIYFEDQDKAELFNINLKNFCEQFLQQNQYSIDYNHGIYLFGLGTYLFIESIRDQEDIECINILKKALFLAKDYEYNILLSIGWIYTTKFQYKESLIWCKKLFESCPTYPGIANNIAITYENLNMFKEAEEFYLKAETQCKNNIIILNNLASFYEKQNNNEKAEEYFQKSLLINPNCEQTYNYYGTFLIKIKKDEEKGLQLLLKGLEINPNCSDIYVELFNFEFERGSLEKCIEYIDKAIEINPRDGYFYCLKGDYYSSLLEYEVSQRWYLKSLEEKLYSDFRVSVSSKLAFCYFYNELFEESIKQFIFSLNLNVRTVDFSKEIDCISILIDQDEYLSNEKKIQILRSIKGLFQQRLLSIITELTNKEIKLILQQCLEEYRNILEIITYQKQVQKYLRYQSDISHWDMYFD